MANLDGKDEIKPTAFDAHEQVTRGHHTHSAEEGYQPAEYEHSEYPKHVGEVVVNDAEEEAAALEAQVEAEAAAQAEEPAPSSDAELVRALLAARDRLQQLESAVDQGSDALFAKDAEIAKLNKQIEKLKAKSADPKPDASE